MLSSNIVRAIITAAALVAASTAEATDLTAAEPAAAAAGSSPWQIRLRGLNVITNDSGRVDGLPGSDLSFSNTVIPEFDISYFFNENIAAELILGTTYANVYGSGSISRLGEIGKTWLLPPTLTLQYHFTDFGTFRPYVGAGVNYTLFYNQSGKSARSLDVKNTFGVALQAGFDYMVDDHWGVNFDAKKIFLRPDFEANVGGAGVSGKAKLDPWLIGAGVTYRF
ncbi:OmpW family protein [Ensifer sp. BR816]|uniref:OmpW/AlkL family protein n=1 Tax=Rhizobium sp. (strain BR816) TaxID=1057002 RepID=UPI00036D88FB|nr:OmpW family protein [Ensifer sp. BR816]